MKSGFEVARAGDGVELRRPDGTWTLTRDEAKVLAAQLIACGELHIGDVYQAAKAVGR